MTDVAFGTPPLPASSNSDSPTSAVPAPKVAPSGDPEEWGLGHPVSEEIRLTTGNIRDPHGFVDFPSR